MQGGPACNQAWLAPSPTPVLRLMIMQYLGVVEQRANELLAQYCLLADSGASGSTAGAAAERAAVVLMGAAQPPLRFVIEPPTSTAGGPAGRAGEELAAAAPAGGPADDERPLSRGSLATRVQRALACKADSAVRIRAVRAPSLVAGDRR